MTRNYISDISVVIIALLIGVGAGYWYGNLSGVQAGIEQQKTIQALQEKQAEKELTSAANPFNTASTNPFSESPANPYKDVKTNPFE